MNCLSKTDNRLMKQTNDILLEAEDENQVH